MIIMKGPRVTKRQRLPTTRSFENSGSQTDPLFFDIIDTVTRQKLTATTNVSALVDTPHVWLSLAEHREKIGLPLRALGESKLQTAAALIVHLEALSLANFVNACANGAELLPAYREVKVYRVKR